MPRKPRYLQTSKLLIYHVLNRGILCQDIFKDKLDYINFLDILKKYKKRYLLTFYHWCLMPNHYHLVMKFLNPNHLSKAIGGIQQAYAKKYHKRYSTAGRFFQSRFKSQVIESKTYLLASGRYVERNPTRAKLVEKPWDWRFSSCKYYVYGNKDGITSTDPEWKNNPDKKDYKEWLLDNKAEQEEKIFKSNASIIGSNLFKTKFEKKDGRVYPRQTGRHKST